MNFWFLKRCNHDWVFSIEKTAVFAGVSECNLDRKFFLYMTAYQCRNCKKYKFFYKGWSGMETNKNVKREVKEFEFKVKNHLFDNQKGAK